MELEVQSERSWHVCLKGTESSGRLGPGCQERRWHQGATCPQRTRVWASQTRAFPLLLLNLMDIRNKTFLIIVLFDSLEICNQEAFAGTSILSPPSSERSPSLLGVAAKKSITALRRGRGDNSTARAEDRLLTWCPAAALSIFHPRALSPYS